MSDWAESPLEALVSFQKGRKVETSAERLHGYERYLGASGILGLPDGFASTNGAVTAANDDVLMLWDGERSGLVGSRQAGVVASTVSRLRPSGAVTGSYLYYALASQFEWIQNRRTGSGVPHVPKEIGRILRIRYPSDVDSQLRIAAILTSLDTAIEATEALIKKHQQIKAGLMHDLFVRGVQTSGELRPLPEVGPDHFCASSIGTIPRAWKVARLAELVRSDITYGIVQAGPHIEDARGVPYVRTGDMSGDFLDRNQMLCTTPEIACMYKRSEVAEGDIVMAIRASVGKVLPVPPELSGANLTQGTAKIAPHDSVDGSFLLWALRDLRFQSRVLYAIKGTTFAEITLADLRQLQIGVPVSLSEQREIAARLNAFQAVLDAESRQLEKLRMQKQGLMQDLLTGKVRVPVPADGSA